MADTEKKQKPGMGGIRPSDFLEDKFKNMCKEKNISQTELFERIFLMYLNSERVDKREAALPLESDINLIAGNLSNILDLFKSIAHKAQDTVIATENNLNVTIGNLQSELQTEQLKNNELSDKILSLETANSAFNEVRNNLEKQLKDDQDICMELKSKLNSSKLECAELLKENKELRKICDEKIDIEKQKETLLKQLANLNSLISDNDALVKKLNSKIHELTNENNDIRNKKNIELQELETKLKIDFERQIKLIKKESDYTVKESNLQLKEELINLKNKNLEISQQLDAKNKLIESLRSGSEIV